MVKDEELLKFGEKLVEKDTEAKRWFNWFKTQSRRFETGQTTENVYKTMRGRYLAYLAVRYEKSVSKKEETEVLDTVSPTHEEIDVPSQEITEKMIYCTNCGEKNHPFSHFCGKCDFKLEKSLTMKVDSLLTKGKEVSKRIIPSEKSKYSLKEEGVVKPIPTQKEPFVNRIRANISEFYEAKAFSRITQVAIAVFFLSFAVGLILGMSGINSGNQAQLLLQIIIFPFYFMILAFVVDILRWREFSEWGALGVLITDLGIIFFFLPGVFFAFPIITQILHQILFLPADFADYVLMIPIGILLIVLGVSLHRTDWDDKIVNLTTMTLLYLRNYQYKAAIGAFFVLIKTTGRGLIASVGGGIVHLPRRIVRFSQIAFSAIKRYFESTIAFLSKTLTKIVKETWRNIHWIGLLALLFYFQFPVSGSREHIHLDLLLIIGFFVILGILYTNQNQATTVIRKTRGNIIKRVVSTYSMLSGSKLDLKSSVFCSRCLRGIQTSEFESLILVKGSMDPDCPFCGSKSWVVAE